MKTMLNLLMELAHLAPYQSELGHLINTQSENIKKIFEQKDLLAIKQHLSNNKDSYFANERTVVLIEN